MKEFLYILANNKGFQHFITGVILFAGILVGLSTYPEIQTVHEKTLDALDQVVLVIFIVEILVKMGAEGVHFYRYFRDPWNVFDFTIVAACFLPVGNQYAMILRLARLLRTLKLVRALPRLQVLVGALLKSIPSMAYVGILLSLLFYLYGVTGVFLFSVNDPVHFGNLQTSILSLFRTVTMEDWTDLMYIQMYGCDRYGYEINQHLCTQPEASFWLSIVYFVSFVAIGTMVMLNLFIGVIMNSMDESRNELDDERARGYKDKENKEELHQELFLLERKMAELHKEMQRLARRTAHK